MFPCYFSIQNLRRERLVRGKDPSECPRDFMSQLEKRHFGFKSRDIRLYVVQNDSMGIVAEVLEPLFNSEGKIAGWKRGGQTFFPNYRQVQRWKRKQRTAKKHRRGW